MYYMCAIFLSIKLKIRNKQLADIENDVNDIKKVHFQK